MSEFSVAVGKSRLTLFSGLKALGANSEHVYARKQTRITGSVNIERDLRRKNSNASLWDYAVGYGNGLEVVHYIEVHPATSGDNMKEMLKKHAWLTAWLEESPLGKMKRKLHWVHTSAGMHIPLNSPHLRSLERLGISRPTRRVRIG
jgi:hypothetical protein